MEINYNEVFGLNDDVDDDVNNDSNDDVNDDIDIDDVDINDDVENDDGEDTKDDDPEQSPEINAKFASMRRKYEEQIRQAEESAAARAEERFAAEEDARIGAMGMVNPFTNVPITNREELRSYQEQQAAEKLKEFSSTLETAGIDQNQIDTLLANHPVVKAAAQEKVELERLRKDAALRETAGFINAEIEKISKIDPSVKSPEDLILRDDADEIFSRVRRGYTLEDAFYIVNRDKLIGDTAARAEQTMRNKMNSKNHLKGTHTEGSGGIEVPADLMPEFRAMMPEKSEDEIRAWYQKDQARMAKKKG